MDRILLKNGAIEPGRTNNRNPQGQVEIGSVNAFKGRFSILHLGFRVALVGYTH